MIATWRRELASAMRRLEAAIPHWDPMPSIVIYAKLETEIATPMIGPFLQLQGPGVRLMVRGSVLPYRLVLFSDTSALQFTKRAVELSECLVEIKHPRLGTEWSGYRQIGGDRAAKGLIEWLLAVHNFARELPETDLVKLCDGQPATPDRITAKASVIGDTATVSAKLADWILDTETVGRCAVELTAEDDPPIVLGKRWDKVLTFNQYAVISLLCKRFPDGATEAEMRKQTGVEHPPQLLMGLMGQRPTTQKPTIWAKVIRNTGRTGIGWRIRSM